MTQVCQLGALYPRQTCAGCAGINASELGQRAQLIGVNRDGDAFAGAQCVLGIGFPVARKVPTAAHISPVVRALHSIAAMAAAMAAPIAHALHCQWLAAQVADVELDAAIGVRDFLFPACGSAALLRHDTNDIYVKSRALAPVLDDVPDQVNERKAEASSSNEWRDVHVTSIEQSAHVRNRTI